MRPFLTFRALVRVTVAAALVVAVAAMPATAQERPTARIVSTSGIPHADVGALPAGARTARPGITPSWRQALDVVLGRIAAEHPDAVLHTGDMVDGRWNVDVSGAEVFGPVRTGAPRRAAVRAAGDHYYPRMRRHPRRLRLRPTVERIEAHGMPTAVTASGFSRPAAASGRARPGGPAVPRLRRRGTDLPLDDATFGIGGRAQRRTQRRVAVATAGRHRGRDGGPLVSGVRPQMS